MVFQTGKISKQYSQKRKIFLFCLPYSYRADFSRIRKEEEGNLFASSDKRRNDPPHFMALEEITIFTDGGCLGNPGPGGWGVILCSGSNRTELSGSERETTNNRMELRAAIAGLSALEEPGVVTVYTDSQYLRQGITEWIRGWKAKGWLTSARQPVKNADLWRELDAVAKQHRITWKWVKGHSGHPENERCDQLAQAAIANMKAGGSPAPDPAPRKISDPLPIQPLLF